MAFEEFGKLEFIDADLFAKLSKNKDPELRLYEKENDTEVLLQSHH